MRNTKLYAVLEYFDKKEQARLRKYLLSPYFNTNEDLVDLFELVIKQINAKNEKVFEKSEIWKKLEGSKKYNDVRFRKYMSDVLKLIEGFLSQEVYEDESFLQVTNLLKGIENKKLIQLYNSSLRKARRLSEQALHKGASYYYYQYLIESSYHKLTDLDNKRTNEDSNEKEIVQNLDFFYLSEKLRLHSTMLSNQYLVKRDMEILFFDEVINHVKQYQFRHIPAISIYYEMHLTQINKNKNHFYVLKNLLNENYSLFPPNQAYEMYTFAINYAIRMLNTGVAGGLQELFKVYKEMLNKEYIISNVEFSPWHFKNIIVIALRLGEFDWTENFIKTFQLYLPKKFRVNAVTYSLAQLYFYQKRYDEVIQKLRDVEFEDFSYNLNSKTMLIATYYETDEIEPLYSLFDSFRVSLRRNKDLPNSRKILYTNLIKFTKKLTRLKPKDYKNLLKIKAEVDATKNIASRSWLLEKIEELEK